VKSVALSFIPAA